MKNNITSIGLLPHLEDLALHLKSEQFRVIYIHGHESYFWFSDNHKIVCIQNSPHFNIFQYSIEYKPVAGQGSGIVLFTDGADAYKEAIGIEPLRYDRRRATMPTNAQFWSVDEFIESKRKFWKDRVKEL